MINYNVIFQKGEHYLTIRDRVTNTANRIKLGSMKQLKRNIRRQPSNSDMFITKYPNNCIVDCIILDLDSEDDKHLALEEAKTIQEVTQEKGLNTVIVSSTKKGFHNYIQVPYRPFKDNGYAQYCKQFPFEYSMYFENYINNLIDKTEEDTYVTLDRTNTSAGLRGNIRVIGSIHPSTNKRCKVVDGDFIPFQPPTDDEWECLNKAFRTAKLECNIKHNTVKIRKRNAYKYVEHTSDPIQDNDLRTLMPSIFGGQSKSYGDYVMMQCPFHNDSNPSLKIKKEWFYCLGCEKKGNIYTLMKNGYVKEPAIRIKELE